MPAFNVLLIFLIIFLIAISILMIFSIMGWKKTILRIKRREFANIEMLKKGAGGYYFRIKKTVVPLDVPMFRFKKKWYMLNLKYSIPEKHKQRLFYEMGKANPLILFNPNDIKSEKKKNKLRIEAQEILTTAIETKLFEKFFKYKTEMIYLVIIIFLVILNMILGIALSWAMNPPAFMNTTTTTPPPPPPTTPPPDWIPA